MPRMDEDDERILNSPNLVEFAACGDPIPTDCIGADREWKVIERWRTPRGKRRQRTHTITVEIYHN